MFKVTALLITIFYFLMGSALFAEERGFVGFTVEEVGGFTSIVSLNSFCDANFKGSRWCQSEDIARNGAIAPVPAGMFTTGWVHASIVAGSATNSVDYSGITGDPLEELTCNAGFAGELPDQKGLTVAISTLDPDPTAQELFFSFQLCTTTSHVACCAPVRK